MTHSANRRKFHLCIVVGLCVLICLVFLSRKSNIANNTLEEGDIVCNLKVYATAEGRILASLSFHNRTNRSLPIMRHLFLFGQSDDLWMWKYFDVQSEAGIGLEYTGNWESGEVSENSFTFIKPDEIIVQNVFLDKNYQFEKQRKYSIQFRVDTPAGVKMPYLRKTVPITSNKVAFVSP